MECPSGKFADHIRRIQFSNVRDERYYESERVLVDAGDGIIPILEQLMKSADPVARERASEIVRKIRKRQGSEISEYPNQRSRSHHGTGSTAVDDPPLEST